MITKLELQELGKKLGTKHLFYLEKEYLQHLFLYNLYLQGNENFVFKGGTALKIVYRHPRFSTDLDFYVPDETELIQRSVHDVLKKLDVIGVKSKLKNEKPFTEKKTYSVDIYFEGPQYDGNEHSLNNIQINAGAYSKLYMPPQFLPVNSSFPDIPDPYFVNVINLEEIVAEKIRALLQRKEAKDFYDVYILAPKYPNPPSDLIKAKLLDVDMSTNVLNPNKFQPPTKDEYENALSNLVDRVPDYNEAVKTIRNYFSRIK